MRSESRADKLYVATPLPDRTPIALPRRQDRSPPPQGVTSPDLVSMSDELQEHVEVIDMTNEDSLNILFVKEDASYDEIMASYRAAILDFHLDKLLVQFEISNTKHGLVGQRCF
ncbi:hypothetical protein ACLOJK_004522 [Asimina triloba]